MTDYGVWQSPLAERYASREMSELFSEKRRIGLWRKLWLALARAEMKLGLNVTPEQVAELEAHLNDIDFEKAAQYERELRHDVMAHVHALGDAAPGARAIIHLGATSCYVGDNADMLIMLDALKLIRAKLLKAVSNLADFALKYKDLPCLGYTHFQPAQPVTVGKRACLWAYDFVLDAEEIGYRLNALRTLGSKGTTGTQASFLDLFGGGGEKVKQLERLIAEEMGFPGTVPVSGQTYTRKFDWHALSALSGVAQSASKFANDMRLLSHLKEVEEPFGGNQIGSSAMPYKRNPMRCERINALSRFVINAAQNPAFTAASQWLERTLDDSANRRLAVSEAFLAADAILNLCVNVTGGLVVHEKMILRHLREELPFMASENVLMEAVKRGGDRQDLHEKIRVYSIEAGKRVKDGGEPNDFLERVANDPAFGLTPGDVEKLLEPALYIGRAPEQVEEFIGETVNPLLKSSGECGIMETEIKV